MDPTTTFCPNLACPARGQTGQGNIGIHSCKDKRFICTECHKTFSATTGTALYRLRTPAETVTPRAHAPGSWLPLQAIVVACGFDERTVAALGGTCRPPRPSRAGASGRAAPELGQVQADEIRVKTQGGIVWMALAMMVATRLWLAGEVSAQRDMTLRRRLIERVRRCALPRPLLVCTDGVCSYVRAMRETFRDPVQTGRGRPQLRPWRNVCIAQVVKRYAQRRIVDVERRMVDGTPARVETLRRRSQGDGVINTAYIERLNATFRERLAALTRRGRALARRTLTLQHGMYLIGTVDNFCTPHASLPRRWQDHTCYGRWHHDHCWISPGAPVVSCAPAALATPPRRGRRSRALQAPDSSGGARDHD